ncbi:MAG: metallophosphoesterase family protein [Ignavibacteriae bacterium]|nr:metallophosphoesterase family protein [Ignavibacteriota bacterium]
MRIAVISDIHSNEHALRKALSIIDKSAIDEIYCLGDIVGYGAFPNECIELIRQRAKHCVIGNHDVAAIDPTFADYFTKHGRIAVQWTHSTLTEKNLEFLKSLPYTVTTDLCTLAHSGPAEPEEFEYVQSLQSAAKQFSAFSTQLCFIGHTHIPTLCGENLKTFVLKNGMRFLINVGSVGQPRDGNPQLSFGIFDTTLWRYQNIRAEYDVEGASRAIHDRGLPPLLGKRLFQGQ